MAVSTPKYFRIIMPIILMAVLGLFYLRLQPVVNSFKTNSNSKDVMLPDSSQAPIGQPVPERLTTPVYLKIRADANVLSTESGTHKGKSYSHPIEVRIDFTGGVASEAHRYGQAKITSAISDTGNSLEVLSIGPHSFRNARAGFILINRSAKDFFTKQPKHPHDGFRLKIKFLKPKKEFERIRSLSGTVTQQIIDPTRTIRIENIGSNLSGPGVVRLKHPKLGAIGEFSLMIRESDPDTMHLIVKGKRLQDLDVRIVDIHSNLVTYKGDTYDTSGEYTTKDFRFSVKNTSHANSHLEIILGYKLIETRFDMKNIVLQK